MGKVDFESGTKFLEKESDLEVITESVFPPKEVVIEPVSYNRRNTDTKFHQFTHSIETNWVRFMNWIKKSIATMMIFILIGVAGGMYISKIIYDIRMKETTMIGGFVYDGRVFDVKLRP